MRPRGVAHTHEVLTALTSVLSLAQDAETGQRGYLMTGDARYLAPFQTRSPRFMRASTASGS